ncbi:hypothetical protein [Sphingomonas psychrotolerans]|uniref:Uncharacterized protein n=1 Tax=Sphingomonas psychrotolerans TaxID=1327635 RepID=A0A2K8MAL5_9SPHN|nr:hypothetical protein [Sphingomonas psychrotolerans]ATY30928.1 hypothetical protein CVN68_02105 [Sphingomonas psychrotolerans]
MSSCVDTLGPGYELCNSNHCNNFQETSIFHATCLCIDWQGNPIPDCNPKNSNYPVQTAQCKNGSTGEIQNISSQACSQLGQPWFWDTCYCCCTCFAANTPIAVPNGLMAIGDLLVNNEVLAAAGTPGSWNWTAQTVTFSAGTPASAPGSLGNMMIYLAYGDNQSLIVSRDQLMVLPDGKLKRADQLVPGTDMLVAADGSAPLNINMLASGYYMGAIHHIATSTPSYDEWDGSIDDHLINANGVVAGDYLLQMYQDMAKMAPNLADPEAPDLGHADYKAANSGVSVKAFVVGESHQAAGMEVRAHNFRAHAESEAFIPAGAFQLFSSRQEALLMDQSIPKRGFSDVTNVQLTSYYIKLFSAFYPKVHVYLDWESIHPNVYAFTQYGTPTVVIAGEFLRLGPLYGPAMAIGIASGIASAGIEANSGDVGRSVYDGIGVVMQQALQGVNTFNQTLVAGQAQFDTLLALLAKLETGGEGGISANCLSQVIDAAISGDPLPECAGGPPVPLTLASASYADGALTISFSEPINVASALNPKSYQLTPNGSIIKLDAPAGVTSSVVATVTLDPGDYSLLVSGVTGATGDKLDPAHSSALFTVGDGDGGTTKA